MQTTFWISPDIDQWRLQREGAYKAERLFPELEEAIDWTCRMAREHAPCRVKVQDHGGRVVKQFEFPTVGTRIAA